MKKLKRILTMLMAFMLCFGMFTNVAKAITETIYVIDFPRASDPNLSGWGRSSVNFMSGWSMGADDKTTMFTRGSFTGEVAYCIEPGLPANSGDVFTSRDEDYWDNYPSNLNQTLNTFQIKAFVGRIFQYSYNGNASAEWTSVNSGASNLAHYLASQILIWEVIVGERDASFNKINAASYGKDNVLDIIQSNHPLRSEIMSYYNQMENSVKNHTKAPSFMSGSQNSSAYELEWNGSNYTLKLTDTNGVLSNYTFSANQSGFEFNVSGNTLTITTNTAPSGNVQITAEKTNGMRSGVVVWSDGAVGGGQQDNSKRNLKISKNRAKSCVYGFL